VFGKAIGGDIVNNKKSWLMTRAFEKADEQIRGQLLAAMEMPVGTDEEKAAKVAAVKEIYASLDVEEEAKQEIARFHGQAMEYAAQIGLSSEKSALLENYAKKLIGRSK
jgi:geranylgeranyl diphosphate synthase type II